MRKVALLQFTTTSRWNGDDYGEIRSHNLITDWQEISDEQFDELNSFVQKNYGYILLEYLPKKKIEDILEEFKEKQRQVAKQKELMKRKVAKAALERKKAQEAKELKKYEKLKAKYDKKS